jgi:hypothetical protein
MQPVALRTRLEGAMLTTCRELAKVLPKEQEREMVRKCEEAFGKKEFKEVVVSAPTPEPTAQVSPPSGILLMRGYPEVPAPETAIEQSPALEPLKPPPPPPPTVVMS